MGLSLFCFFNVIDGEVVLGVGMLAQLLFPQYSQSEADCMNPFKLYVHFVMVDCFMLQNQYINVTEHM